MLNRARNLAIVVLALAIAAGAQVIGATQAYQPKFPGDPAHSQAEAAALGFMRTVAAAQREYKKKHDSYASSLGALVGSGSFTRRMTRTDRGDYLLKFHGNGKDYMLAMVPKQFDAEHRAFFMDESEVIRGEEEKPATQHSPPLKAD